jgi:kynurenine formamidase
MRTFTDLSLPIRATASEATPVTISHLDHHEAPRVLGLEPHDFPDGMAISNEHVALTTHTGTHMDAPFHYGPFSGGRPARKIADIPLAWCYGRGVRLDVRHRGPGEEVSAADIMEAEKQTGTALAPLDIVLIWTGCDRLWGKATYLTDYPGLGRDAVAYLVKQGVRVIGIDAWGLDRPMEAMLRDYRSTGDRSYLWPAHLYGREQEYCQLEKLANLHLLPFSYGFQVLCFPIFLEEAGAAWTRVVAVLE